MAWPQIDKVQDQSMYTPTSSRWSCVGFVKVECNLDGNLCLFRLEGGLCLKRGKMTLWSYISLKWRPIGSKCNVGTSYECLNLLDIQLDKWHCFLMKGSRQRTQKVNHWGSTTRVQDQALNKNYLGGDFASIVGYARLWSTIYNESPIIISL